MTFTLSTMEFTLNKIGQFPENTKSKGPLLCSKSVNSNKVLHNIHCSIECYESICIRRFRTLRGFKRINVLPKSLLLPPLPEFGSMYCTKTPERRGEGTKKGNSPDGTYMSPDVRGSSSVYVLHK